MPSRTKLTAIPVNAKTLAKIFLSLATYSSFFGIPE